MLTYTENINEDDNEEEQFFDVNDSEDERKNKNPKKTKVLHNKQDKENETSKKTTVYDPFKRDPLYCNADNAGLWELTCLLNHYHPQVRKYAEMLIEKRDESSNIIEYDGNPLLDFNLANFLDRFTFSKAKKKESSGIKSLINKKKIRMSKITDPLSIEEVRIFLIYNLIFFYQG